jgi:hypothetical protein
MVKRTCANNGCTVAYEEEENNDSACVYHPGAPVFHEGLKGWSCCKKRVIGFDEFMQIPGCYCGAHKPHVPQEPQQKSAKPAASAAPLAQGVLPEVYKSQPMPKPAQPTTPAPPPPVEEEDPVDAVIAPGTNCKHLGCNKVYIDDGSRFEECVYHPGAPLFHEGSKGYTCCRMVGGFEEFLKLPGCKKGKHKFTEKKSEDNQVVCRHDWYQMGPAVVVCIYAKNVDKEKSSIVFGPQSLAVDIVFNDGKQFTKKFSLSQDIVPEKSKYEFLTSKVEIKLQKTGATQWSSLE